MNNNDRSLTQTHPPPWGLLPLLDIAVPKEKSPDYPPPPAVHDTEEFVWDDDLSPIDNYVSLGKRLATTGDLYRMPGYAGGLLLASGHPGVPPTPIQTGRQLVPILVDRVRVRILKEGNASGSMVAPAHLSAMLGSEAFLQQFKAVDLVVKTPGYLPDFKLVRPGYNDGGPGRRVLYVGLPPRVERAPEAINAFLDVMDLAGNADRTNAVAAALTVLLRSFWPGAKPALVVTSTKSHGGKDTVILFASGSVPSVSVSYQSTDWALERSFVGALKHSPETGLVNVENARLAKGSKYIASAYLERFLTDPEPLLFSTGTGGPVRRVNDVVLALSTNFGTVSEDLMNRALPIHLTPRGDVARRESPIGNPKLEYLPAHRERIEAELRGMVEKWKEAGRPLDTSVRHPFTQWARTVGGILTVNGFTDFLGNYSLRKTHDDPVRQALGLLGTSRPDAWQRPAEWARLAVRHGLVAALVAEGDRRTDAGRERGMGVVLSAHQDETFWVETDDQKVTLRLERARRRFEPAGEPSTRYRFVSLHREAVPEEPVLPDGVTATSTDGAGHPA